MCQRQWVPGVGRGIARNLLKHFKTIRNVFEADEKKLKEVDKVGKIKAKKISEILDRKYKG